MIAIAIDDEPVALDIIQNHAGKVPFLDLQKVYTNAFEALEYLGTQPVDLIFLDIKMPDINGIDFLQSLTKPPMVIFTTAYTEHAVQSFELDAIDYLLKPFSLARFLKACNKAHELLEMRNALSTGTELRPIFIKDGYEQIKVDPQEILYAEAAGNYTKIYLTGDRLLSTRVPISEMLMLLPENDFVRTHRAFIVAKNKVDKFDRAQIYIGQHIIPIGPSYAQHMRGFV